VFAEQFDIGVAQVNIGDSFDLNLAQVLGTVLSEEENTELAALVKGMIADTGEVLTDDQLEFIIRVATFTFIAGRTYQNDMESTVTVSMTPAAASAYIAYLASQSTE
jgi:hypothetical protein